MRVYVDYCLGDAAELEVADGTDLNEPFTGYCHDTQETLRVLRPWDANIEIIDAQ